MKQNRLVFLLFITLINSAFAQKPFTKEAGIYSDNDSFTNLFNDGYYTNGLTFFYKYLPQNQDSTFPKRIAEWNFGIKMYTPESGDAPRIIEQDRPFAGYLFGSAIMNYFYENESYMKLGVSLGIIGPSSGGGNLQRKFHKLLGIYEVAGWEYQIKDLLALNANFMYSKKIARFFGKNADIHAIADASLGTVETNIGFGLMNRFSIYPANKIYLSDTYGGLIDKKPLKRSQRVSEFFVFIKPMIYYRAYDATIQGSMFNDDSPVTFEIEPVLYSIETGIIFQLYRVNVKYSVTFNSIEVLNDKVKAQTYGTLNLSYIF